MEHIFYSTIEKITDFLTKDTLCSEARRKQLIYGLQVFAYNVFVISVILILAAICRCFLTSLLIFAVFGTFRILAGGYHCNSMAKCLLTTTAVIVGSGKCAQFIAFSLPVTILLCIDLNAIFLSHTPRGTAKNPFSESYSRLQKRRLRIASITLSCAAIFLPPIRSCILPAMLFAALFLSPVFRKKSSEPAD